MSDEPKSAPPTASASRGEAFPRRTIVVLAFAVALGFGAVYALLGRGDGDDSLRSGPGGATSSSGTGVIVGKGVAPPLPSGAGSNPLSVGQMATFVFKKAPEPLPEVAFVDAAGKARSLADFKGRVVLLNLWATWCAPCRKEMPGLDALEAGLGSNDFEVVALSVDRAGVEASKKFLDQIKVAKLRLYVDASARASSALRVVGLPATLLIDRQGREIGRLSGPAEWDSPEARRLIDAALKGG